MEQIRRTLPPGRLGGSADCLVLLAVLIGLVALLILVLLARPGVGLREVVPDPYVAVWIWTFAIGVSVGAAELISRYRDNPGAALRSRPGLLFIALNGLAANLTLFFIRHFELAGINREVDRRRVPDRNKRVAERAHELRNYQFKLAAPFLTSALAAFQDMDEEDAKRLRDEYLALEKDANFAAYTDEVKFYLVGFDILTVFGEQAFDSMFDSLTNYMKGQMKDPDRELTR